MPAAARAVTEEEDTRDSNEPAPQAEAIRLWLPSDLTFEQQKTGCKEGLGLMEQQLQVAQCSDALRQLRSRLHAKRYLITQRNTHSTGQHATTRSRGLIARMGEKVEAAADKYRAGRAALVGLLGAEGEAKYRELKAEDIMLDDEELRDGIATRKHGQIGSRRARVHTTPKDPNDEGRKLKKLSWVWTTIGKDEEDAQIHECMCSFMSTNASSCQGRMVKGKGQKRTMGRRGYAFGGGNA